MSQLGLTHLDEIEVVIHPLIIEVRSVSDRSDGVKMSPILLFTLVITSEVLFLAKIGL